MFERLGKAGWQYSIGVRMLKPVRGAVEAIDEDAWRSLDYPEEGGVRIAETVYGDRRLIVRRTRLLGARSELWPDWRHFCFITNRTDDLAVVEAEHRDRVVVERVIAALHLPDALTPEQTRRLMRVAEACPVRRAIEAGMEFGEHLAEPATAA